MKSTLNMILSQTLLLLHEYCTVHYGQEYTLECNSLKCALIFFLFINRLLFRIIKENKKYDK